MTSPTPSQPEEITSPRVRVLIADDVQETRRTIRLMLAAIPEVEIVAIAQDGRQAVDLAHQYQPDLALMDVNMPEMDGLSAIRFLLKMRPDMVCVVISAERDRHTLREAMAAGARGYLVKPFTLDELEELIGIALEQVAKNRDEVQQAYETAQQRDAALKQLAQEYASSHRYDNKSVKVYEALAANPQCDLRWLMNLAMIYVLRKEWGKLKELADRLEKQSD